MSFLLILWIWAEVSFSQELRGGHKRMLQDLERIRDTTAASNPYLAEAKLSALRRARIQLQGGPSTQADGHLLLQLARAELNQGEVGKAIEALKEAQALLQRIGGSGPAQAELHLRLGIAWFRMAETINCCQQRTAESCLLPIQGKGLHLNEEPSRKAMGHFLKVLETPHPDQGSQMRAHWLLNIAAMTVGAYPVEVPEKFRIPEASFRSKAEFPRFQNVAGDLKIDSFDLAGGMVVDDFDGDGDFDLIRSSYDPARSLSYFHNDGKGGFIDRSKEAGFEGFFGGLNLRQADYDNDGDLDLLVLRGGWFEAEGRHPNSLLRNDGSGGFVDVTFESGLGLRHYPTQTADWADYDNDGDLDLYVGNESTDAIYAPCQLFRNNGDGTFTDVVEVAGVENEGFTKGVMWGDYDHDRWPDLMVSNYRGANRLYHNQGDGTFKEVAEEAGVSKPLESFPVWFWDPDNDGNLDLFVASYQAKAADVLAHYLGLKSRLEPAGVYRGNGKGQFVNVSTAMGLDYPMLPMGSNFGDLDNDGFLDFYLGTGEPEISTIVPNVLFRNVGGTHFEDVTFAAGVGHLQKGHAVALADFDGDGDLDLFEQMGGAKRVDEFADALFLNPGASGNWLQIKLVGTASNRCAIGARIHAVVADPQGQERSIYRHVNSGGSFGGNPLTQHVGLGVDGRLLKLQVFWPTTGKTQVVDVEGVNRRILVEER